MHTIIVIVLLVAAYMAYTAIGAIFITSLDDRFILRRWYDSFRWPWAPIVHMLFWAAWPYFLARLFIHQASPHQQRRD